MSYLVIYQPEIVILKQEKKNFPEKVLHYILFVILDYNHFHLVYYMA